MNDKDAEMRKVRELAREIFEKKQSSARMRKILRQQVSSLPPGLQALKETSTRFSDRSVNKDSGKVELPSPSYYDGDGASVRAPKNAGARASMLRMTKHLYKPPESHPRPKPPDTPSKQEYATDDNDVATCESRRSSSSIFRPLSGTSSTTCFKDIADRLVEDQKKSISSPHGDDVHVEDDIIDMSELGPTIRHRDASPRDVARLRMAGRGRQRRRSTIHRTNRVEVMKMFEGTAHERDVDHRRRNAEKRLLPPPPYVMKLIDGSVADDDDDEEMKATIRRAALEWLPDALAHASISTKIKTVERRLLGTKLFTTNLGWAGCWKRLCEILELRMKRMGMRLEDTFRRNPDRELVEKYTPTLGFGTAPATTNERARRQDDHGLVPTPRGITFNTTFEECCYIHYLRLIATALDAAFQRSVDECLGGFNATSLQCDRFGGTGRPRRVSTHLNRWKKGLIVDRPFHHGIKGFERMFNKMNALDDHRFETRPRPALNLDINRCLVVCENAKKLRDVLLTLRLRYGAFVKFKNGFAMTEQHASETFYLRLCLVSISFSHSKLRTIGDLCDDPDVQRLWVEYENTESPNSVSRETWKRQIQTALGWLRRKDMRRRPVTTACEVQVLLRESRDVRMVMHEMYKVWRCEDELHVFRDFENYVKKEHQAKAFRDNGRTLLCRAARDGDLATIREELSRLRETLTVTSTSDEEFRRRLTSTTFPSSTSSLISDISETPSVDSAMSYVSARASSSFQHEVFDILRVACFHARLKVVRFLFTKNYVETETIRGANGLLILMHAITGDGSEHAWNERAILVTVLLNNFVDVATVLRRTDENGVTALYRAALIGHREIVDILLRTLTAEHDAEKTQLEVDRVCANGYTALFIASNMGHVDVVTRLLRAGARTNVLCYGCPAIVAASHNCHVDVVRTLVEVGHADVNAVDRNGCTALYMACLRGGIDVASYLVGVGVKINMQTEDGNTALCVAMQLGYKDVAKVLLEDHKRIDINMGTINGGTPIFIAISRGLVDVVDVLINQGAKLDGRVDADGNTPLHVACRLPRESDACRIAHLLLRGGANVRAENTHGETALVMATKCGYETLVMLLLDNGADPNSCEDEDSPLMIATRQGSKRTVQALLKAGASPKHRTRKGWSPLHVAAHRGHFEIVKSLIDHPWTNPKDTTHTGETATSLARRQNHTEIEAMLRSEGSRTRSL